MFDIGYRVFLELGVCPVGDLCFFFEMYCELLVYC